MNFHYLLRAKIGVNMAIALQKLRKNSAYSASLRLCVKTRNTVLDKKIAQYLWQQQVYTEIERIMSETRTLTFAEFDSVPRTILRTQDSRIA